MSLSEKQQHGVLALLTEPSHIAAAKRAGISLRQLYRWKDLPEFQSALAEAQRSALEVTTRQLGALSSEAVTLLAECMRDIKAGKLVRIRAAIALLTFTLKLKELSEFSQRLDVIERTLNTTRGTP